MRERVLGSRSSVCYDFFALLLIEDLVVCVRWRESRAIHVRPEGDDDGQSRRNVGADTDQTMYLSYIIQISNGEDDMEAK